MASVSAVHSIHNHLPEKCGASAPTASAFDGNRYVFGYITTKTVSLDTRVNWTFTPDLTLQLFALPFIASGDYSSFREFAAPRTLDKLVYGRDAGMISYDDAASTYRVDPDASGPAQPLGDFDFGRARTAIFRQRPLNVFQVKATYWFGR